MEGAINAFITDGSRSAKDYKYDIILANVNGKLQRYQIWI